MKCCLYLYVQCVCIVDKKRIKVEKCVYLHFLFEVAEILVRLSEELIENI